MSVINTGKIFANGEQLTADKLNQVIDQATFNANEAVDGSTITLIGGAMAVNDDGITEAKIDNGAVTTNKIPDGNITKAKIENVADMKVLGNTSGAAAAPQEVEVIDESSGIGSNDNDTSIPTSAAVKSYVDDALQSSSAFQARAGCVYHGSTQTLAYSNGVSGVTRNGIGDYRVILSSAAPSSKFPVCASVIPISSTTKNLAVGANAVSTTEVDVNIEDSDGSPVDLQNISVVVFY